MEVVLGGSWMVIPTMNNILLFVEVLMYCIVKEFVGVNM